MEGHTEHDAPSLHMMDQSSRSESDLQTLCLPQMNRELIKGGGKKNAILATVCFGSCSGL